MKIVVAVISILSGVVVSIPAVLATQTGPIVISKIRTGWNWDAFAIETNQAIVNPANCTQPDAYISDSTNPGHKTHYAATLMAFSLGKPMTVVISDTECIAGRPKIWGIHLAP